MPRFTLSLPEKELEILEKVSEAAQRTKTGIFREFVRSMKGQEDTIESFAVGSQVQTTQSCNLTRADIEAIVDTLVTLGWIGRVSRGEVIEELVANDNLVGQKW